MAWGGDHSGMGRRVTELWKGWGHLIQSLPITDRALSSLHTCQYSLGDQPHLLSTPLPPPISPHRQVSDVFKAVLDVSSHLCVLRSCQEANSIESLLKSWYVPQWPLEPESGGRETW